MSIAIISSTKDLASTNIKENLINDFNFKELDEKFDNNNICEYTINARTTSDTNSVGNEKNNKIIIKLYTINSELIFTDDLDKKIDADIFVFISKHRAQEGRASLTCHAIGNFGEAKNGGKEETLCPTDASLLKNIFIELSRNSNDSDYEVTSEATHHGPYMEKQVLFVELGSNEEYWKDKKGGKIIAKSIIKAIKKYNETINNNSNENKIINNNGSIENNKDNPNNIEKNNLMGDFESVFLIGGGHYSHVANKAMLKGNIAVGHICAKYNLPDLDEDLIKDAIEKCKAKFVLLDWKGLGKEKARIMDILEKNNIPFKRSDQLII